MRPFGAAVLLTLAVGAGCRRDQRVDLRPHARTFKPDQYEDVLKHWTRSRLVIRSFDTIIHFHTTYQSAEFVSAQAVLRSKHYRLTRGEHRRELQKRLAQVRAHHEFYFAATTNDPDWNDFDRDNSIWQLRLIDDKGTRVKPLRIKKLRVTQVHRTYFPYTGLFYKAYRVIFPRQVGGKPFITPRSRFFKLLVASPLASAEVSWILRPPKKK